VPPTELVNAINVEFPEHIVCVEGVAVAIGPGDTVIVTVIGVPEQAPTEGVTVYTAVPAVVPVAVNV
jgi:hypothetical protein